MVRFQRIEYVAVQEDEKQPSLSFWENSFKLFKIINSLLDVF
jgi:hypothetical protein